MSVFTAVSEAELRAFLSGYTVGELLRYEGIEEGIENTNFFVDTEGAPTAGRFVLTLFERTEYAALPYFLGVMAHLNAAGIPGARPIAARDGRLLGTLNGRPAALVERLSGGSLQRPDAGQCAEAAAALARLHLAGASFPDRRENCRGPAWWTAAARQLRPVLDRDSGALLDDEIAFQAAQDDRALPGGVIHADLFRDNALFADGRLSGFIDYYYACNDAWLYDLAVMVNDWAINAGDGQDMGAWDAMLAAYAAQRPFTAGERQLWNAKLRAAALRFWVSRLVDWHFPRDGALTYRKDPAEFGKLLVLHREHTLPLPA